MVRGELAPGYGGGDCEPLRKPCALEDHGFFGTVGRDDFHVTYDFNVTSTSSPILFSLNHGRRGSYVEVVPTSSRSARSAYGGQPDGGVLRTDAIKDGRLHGHVGPGSSGALNAAAICVKLEQHLVLLLAALQAQTQDGSVLLAWLGAD